MSTLATPITIPVINAAKQENTRRSLRIPIILRSPCRINAEVIYNFSGLRSVRFPTYETDRRDGMRPPRAA
jgi:hypothetical protein